MRGSNEDLISSLKGRGILRSDGVEEAMRKAPREMFVCEGRRSQAYRDAPLPTRKGQTISQPTVVVQMTQWLAPRPGDRVLEIGTGSGWQAAILHHLVQPGGKVYTVERVEVLAMEAEANLREAGLEEVQVLCGDGGTGWKEHAPYDRIICTAATPLVPAAWKRQLSDGGRIVAPVGSLGSQAMVVLEKENGRCRKVKEAPGYRFVPLRGEGIEWEDGPRWYSRFFTILP